MVRKLKAPKGTDEANANGKSYRVENDGTVEVPDDAVQPLLDVGGFVEVDETQVEVPTGMVLVKSADPTASCGGEKVGDKFMVDVLTANELVSHGFSIVEQVAAPPAADLPQQ